MRSKTLLIQLPHGEERVFARLEPWVTNNGRDSSESENALVELSMLRLEQGDAVRIARRRHLPHIGVEIRRLLVGDDGGFVGRHLICRVTKLIEKTLERKLRSRDARAGL